MTPLPADVFEQRLRAVRERIEEREVDAGVWFDSTAIEFLVGFPHVVTERPVILVVTGETTQLVVPKLERARARSVGRVDSVKSYFDYPAERPMNALESVLSDLDIGTVAADAESPPSVMGYEGVSLPELVEVVGQSWIREARRYKSEPVRERIVESARWADRIHDLLTDLTVPGANPVVVSERAMTAGTELITGERGDEYDPQTRFRGPVLAGIVSGDRTAEPHGYTSNEPLSPGDAIITGVVIEVGGYMAELERTLFVDPPTAEQRELFEIMCEAQSKAIDAIEPGVAAAHVDGVARDHFGTRGVIDHVQHHTGHAIGMEIHEPPYLDRGSDATIRAGDVYAIEPALYADGNGYRHSDTVIVENDGARRITETSRSLESNRVTSGSQ